MGKTLMIEIDEATKGIMNDLQSSIAANIEGGVSAGLHRLSEETQIQLSAIQSTLSTQLSSLEEGMTNTQKPITRLSRDVGDVLSVISKLKMTLQEKLEKAEQIQVDQIQALNEQIEANVNLVIENQQALKDESLKQIKTEMDNANSNLAKDVVLIKQSFTELVEFDLATQETMNEMISSLAATVESGVSPGLQRLSEDTQIQLTALQSTLSTQLSSLKEGMTHTQKPITRLSRDVGDVLSVISKLKTTLQEKLEKAEQIQVDQIQSLNEQIEANVNFVIENQQALKDESLKQIKTELDRTNTNLAEEVAILNQSITELLEFGIATQGTLNELKSSLAATIEGGVSAGLRHLSEDIQMQLTSLESSITTQLLQSDSTMQKQMKELQRFDAKYSTVTTKIEAQLDVLQKGQEEFKQLATELKLNQVSLEQQLNNQQTQLELMKKELMDGLDQKSILQKLNEIHRKLEYTNLPFYKKWFKRKGVEK
ncbi:hypothetical protein ABES02_27650 [Neobacillus pocheonensis]|uniref:hypothetical protein n=1 Tax=Neobacillus pocheonensis TaxID=363869 RepID=UPI003D26897A